MKSTRSSSGHRTWVIPTPLLAIIVTFTWLGLSGDTALAGEEIKDPPRFTKASDYSSAKDWNLKMENLSPRGHNPLYFPGELLASDALPHQDTSSFGKHHREARKQPTPPVARVTEQQATEIALNEVPGEVTSVSIERKGGKNVYVVEILAKEDGVETDVFVDIESGEVVGTDK